MSDLEELPDTYDLGIQDGGEPVAIVPAVVEPKIVAQPEVSKEEVESEAEAEEVLVEDRKKRSGVARLKAKLEYERSERERLAHELEMMRNNQKPAHPQQVTGKPTIEQFQTYDDYENAKDEWIANEAVRRFQVESSQREREKELQVLDQTWKQKVQALQAKDDDFDEAETLQALASAGVMLGPFVAEAIYTSDAGPELLKYLRDDMDEARRIAALSPAKAARELGRLETRLVGAVEKPQPKPKPSQAPPPIAPVVARGAAPNPSRYDRFQEF